ERGRVRCPQAMQLPRPEQVGYVGSLRSTPLAGTAQQDIELARISQLVSRAIPPASALDRITDRRVVSRTPDNLSAILRRVRKNPTLLKIKVHQVFCEYPASPSTNRGTAREKVR